MRNFCLLTHLTLPYYRMNSFFHKIIGSIVLIVTIFVRNALHNPKENLYSIHWMHTQIKPHYPVGIFSKEKLCFMFSNVAYLFIPCSVWIIYKISLIKSDLIKIGLAGVSVCNIFLVSVTLSWGECLYIYA